LFKKFFFLFQRILNEAKEKKYCEVLVDGFESKVKKIGLSKK